MNCRFCQHPLGHVFLDLGHAPPSNAYLDGSRLDTPEQTFPLKLYVCDRCWLVQTHDYARPEELFDTNYAYFSSTSKTWLMHAKQYFDLACARFDLGPRSFVVEVACNDGYLLQHFVNAKVPCLGIEPTASTAKAAEARGVHVRREFFTRTLGEALAQQGWPADLIIANNVYAHVPDISDFTAGLRAALKPGGAITLEFPHLLRMVEGAQFDTAYHEHYSYLSLYTVDRIFAAEGLRIFDVDELATHGGSLRVYGCHIDDTRATGPNVGRVLAKEKCGGLRDLATYHAFQACADRIKDDLLLFLIDHKRRGRTVGAYGAAAKGNTLLNYAGIKRDLLPFVCDAAPSKQGKYLPGSHIPIMPPSALDQTRPDIVLILPWNIAQEIIAQERAILGWNVRFAVAVPRMELCDV